MIAIRIVACCLLLYAITATPAAAKAIPSRASADVVLTVTNATDDVNGDTSSIEALQRSPGPDGISLREAMMAADNTDGPKTIRFAPQVKGATIRVGSGNVKRLLPPLARGSLTIEGDIVGDGTPGVTIDWSLGQTSKPLSGGFFIWSSGNTISHLRLVQFAGEAVSLTCLDPRCLPRTIDGNRIVGNVITTQSAGSISIGTLGLITYADAAGASGLTVSGTEITNNTIDSGTDADGVINIHAANWGAARNLVTGTRIVGNRLTGGRGGVILDTSDVDAPEDLQLPPPAAWADGNRIEDTLIDDNVISGFQFHGIAVAASTNGNTGNATRRVKITNNTIAAGRTNAEGILGVWLGSAQSQTSLRITSDNVVEDVEIRGNHIKDVGAGVTICGGGKQGDDHGTSGVANNRVQRIVVADNDISYWVDKHLSSSPPAGVRIWGGWSQFAPSAGTSRNVVHGVRITGNRFAPDVAALTRARYSGDTAGVDILGGVSFFGGRAQGNEVTGVTISDNTVAGNTKNTIGIRLVGGSGDGAADNRVVISEIHGNTVDPKDVDQRVLTNDNGAAGNSVAIPTSASPTPSANTALSPAEPARETVPPPATLAFVIAGLAALALIAGISLARRNRRI